MGAKDGQNIGFPPNLGCFPPGISSACCLVLSWVLCFDVILVSHDLFTFVEHKLEASRPPSLCLYLHPSPPSSSSPPTHIPTPPTGYISIYLSIAPGCRRYKHFMWCVSAGLHISLTLGPHCCTSAAVNPPPHHHHHLEAPQQSIHITTIVRHGRGRP